MESNSFFDGMVTPGAQSLFTGLLTGLTAGSFTAITTSANPYQVFLLAGSASALLSWMLFQGRWMALIEAERVIQYQEPPVQAALQAQPERVRIELVQENGRREDWIDLPFPEKLPLLASGLLTGRQFAQSVWTGGRGIFSRSEFEELRSEMLKRGLLRWRNEDEHSQGVDVTLAGRAILKHFSPTHPPSRE